MGNTETVEVVWSVGMVCKLFSEVTSCVVSAILLTVEGTTGVEDFVVFAEAAVDKDLITVSLEGEAGTRVAVVELVLNKPGRVRGGVVAVANVVVVVVVNSSTVIVFVLVPVSTKVISLGTVVLSETLVVSETGAGTLLEADEHVVFAVPSFKCTTALLLVVVGPSAEVLI